MSAEAKEYSEHGFLVQRKLVESSDAGLIEQVESSIAMMAADLGVEKEIYLSAVSRWGLPNVGVQQLIDQVIDTIAPLASELLGGQQVEIIRASLIRKSGAAAKATH